jgi:hypothetical protein
MVEIVECQCTCHTGKGGMIHFRSCCEGMCLGCGRYYKTGLEEHNKECPRYEIMKAIERMLIAQHRFETEKGVRSMAEVYVEVRNIRDVMKRYYGPTLYKLLIMGEKHRG